MTQKPRLMRSLITEESNARAHLKQRKKHGGLILSKRYPLLLYQQIISIFFQKHVVWDALHA